MKKSTLLLLTILLVAFNSCKKDDDNEPTIPTVQEGTALVSATINEKEIGGNNLSVSSVYYPDSPIKDNSFKTIVSQNGTQVVFVLDENNSLRGLSYTKENGNNYELVPIDAASTLISLFLLTPGITTTTSEETLELINNLESLSSYQNLKTEVQNNLPQYNLEQLLAKENINTLYENVIIEYIEKIPSISSTKSTKIDLYGNRLSVMKNQDGMVEISNQAFRRINVYRSYIENNQVTDSKLLFESMKGGVGVSWGSLFTFSSFEPTINVDEEYLPPTQSAVTEYWIIGPGNAESEEIPPSYINTNYDQALTETCIYYVLFPMIDLLTGTSKLIDKDGFVQDVFESTKEIRAGRSGLKYLDDMKNASNKKAFNSAMINYAVLIGKTAIAIPAIANFVGVSTEVAGTIGTCLAIISIPMSVANLSAFTADYFKQPNYSKFIITTQLDAPILLLPENNSQEESSSITLSWEKNELAWKYVIEISENANFEDKIIKTTDKETTNLTITLNPSTIYYWRVYCTKSDGSPSENSEEWKFTTGEDGSLEEILSNDDGSCELTFSWNIGNSEHMPDLLKEDINGGFGHRFWYGYPVETNPISDNKYGFAVSLTPSSYPFELQKVEIFFNKKSTVDQGFYLHVWDEQNNNLLPEFYIPAGEITSAGWWEKDISDHNISITSGKVKVGICQKYLSTFPYPPPLPFPSRPVFLGADSHSEGNSEIILYGKFQGYGGSDFMIRAEGSNTE